MVSTSGTKLLQDEAVEILKKRLFPQALLLTPNIPEASLLAQVAIEKETDLIKAAEIISKQYGCAVLCKGSHSINQANDLLYWEPKYRWFAGERINNPNTHGTGCTLSSAIISGLAKGMDWKLQSKQRRTIYQRALRASA